jgi:hypothetical protein
MTFGFVRTLGNEKATCATHGSCQVRQEAFLSFGRPCANWRSYEPLLLPLFPFFPALGSMYFCMFQEVMFVSLKYAILASPGHIVSTPSRTSQDDFRRLNRLRTWPGTPYLAMWVLGVGRQQLAYRESETHTLLQSPRSLSPGGRSRSQCR